MALVSACTRPATTQRGRAPSPRGDKRARTQVRKRHHRKRGQAAPRIVPDSGHAGLASGRGDELTMNLPAADPLLPGLCGGHWHRAHADSAAYSLARLTMPRRAARRRSPIGNELRRRGRHPETSGQFGQSVGSTVQPWKLLQHNDIRAAKTVAAQHTPTPPKILEWGPLDSRDEGRDFFLHTVENFGRSKHVVPQWVSVYRGGQFCCVAMGFAHDNHAGNDHLWRGNWLLWQIRLSDFWRHHRQPAAPRSTGRRSTQHVQCWPVRLGCGDGNEAF
jgi:hypothetical protein